MYESPNPLRTMLARNQREVDQSMDNSQYGEPTVRWVPAAAEVVAVNPPDVWVNGIRYVPASARSAPALTWKPIPQDRRTELLSSTGKVLGWISNAYEGDHTAIAQFRNTGTGIGNFKTEKSARAALIRWWTGIVRTEL